MSPLEPYMVPPLEPLPSPTSGSLNSLEEDDTLSELENSPPPPAPRSVYFFRLDFSLPPYPFALPPKLGSFPRRSTQWLASRDGRSPFAFRFSKASLRLFLHMGFSSFALRRVE